jgi:hypothetical protein
MAIKKIEMKKAKVNTKASTAGNGRNAKGKETKDTASATLDRPARSASAGSEGATNTASTGVMRAARAKQGRKPAAAPSAPTAPADASIGPTAPEGAATAGHGAPASATGAPRGKRGHKAATAPSAPVAAADALTRPLPRDPRLPEPGTVLRKLDRNGNVRCECTVEEDGVRYAGTVYRSLSAAAGAAAKDLGIKGAQNGYVFWSLVKPARQATEARLVRLQKSWERYAICARAVLATAADDEKPELLAAIERHRQAELKAA